MFRILFTAAQKPKCQPHIAVLRGVLRGVFFGAQMLRGKQRRVQEVVLAQKYCINVRACRQI